MLTRRRAAIGIALLLVLQGCARPRTVEAPHGSAGHGPLRDVVLLPLTTRSSERLLGHVLHEDGVTPNRGLSLFRAGVRLTETSQNVTVVRAFDAHAGIAADYGAAAAEVSAGEVTHLAYVVHITGYASVTDDAEYRAESDCCFNGEVHAPCEAGYVEQLVRGSGTIKYLSESHVEAAASADHVFESKAGERFRVVDETSFEDAFFAFAPGDTAQLCRGLPDVASFAPLPVVARPNCSVMAFDLRGESAHQATFLPDEETCRTVAWDFCRRATDCVRCVGTFAAPEGARPFRLDVRGSTEVRAARLGGGAAVASESDAASVGDAASVAGLAPEEVPGSASAAALAGDASAAGGDAEQADAEVEQGQAPEWNAESTLGQGPLRSAASHISHTLWMLTPGWHRHLAGIKGRSGGD